jgi:hypothetical protein
MSTPAPAPPSTQRWAAALVALPVVTALLCLPLRREELADTLLPPADGPVPLELVGAAWLLLPLVVLLSLAVTTHPDGAPRRWARTLALVAAGVLGTVTFVMTPSVTDAGYLYRTFGDAAGRVDALGDGVVLGMLGAVGALLVTVLVLVVAFRRPAGWEDWTAAEQRVRTRDVGRRLGRVLLGLLVVALVVVALTTA